MDGHRPPTKREPFAAMNSHAPVHTVDWLLPEELYEVVRRRLDDEGKRMRYARVFVSLLDVVTGDFFSQYVKAGTYYSPTPGL